MLHIEKKSNNKLTVNAASQLINIETNTYYTYIFTIIFNAKEHVIKLRTIYNFVKIFDEEKFRGLMTSTKVIA